MIKLEIMKDASEIIRYDSPVIPLAVQERKLSDYEGMRALSHWHKDIELIQVREGRMNYSINGRIVLLNTGDCLMVNSKQLHFGFSHNADECIFRVLLFDPGLLDFNPDMYRDNVRIFTENPETEFLHFTAGSQASEDVHRHIDRLVEVRAAEKKTESYRQIGILYSLWDILKDHLDTGTDEEQQYNSELRLQKEMIKFICSSYKDTVTLDDIAASANICRSTCCRIFQKYVGQTPIDYLNSYRLEISRRLLCNTTYSVTQIAFSCGYNYVSYFSKAFQKKYNMTPRKYRNAHRSSQNARYA